MPREFWQLCKTYTCIVASSLDAIKVRFKSKLYPVFEKELVWCRNADRCTVKWSLNLNSWHAFSARIFLKLFLLSLMFF